MVKVISVNRDGCFEIMRLLPEDYSNIHKDFPDIKIGRITKATNLYVLLKPLTISIELEHNGALTHWIYKFDRGYVTDFASVPAAFRSLVDNDSRYVLAAAMVHDCNYAGQLESFEDSNELFKQMIEKVGGPWWEAFIAWLGVSSPAGVYYYNHPDRSDNAHFKRLKLI